MTPATFYMVNGPRGMYYAVRNHKTGKIWTERTESAAQQQAADEGLALIETQAITHPQLLDLMIPQKISAHAASSDQPADANTPTRVAVTRVQTGMSQFLHHFQQGRPADKSAR